MVNGFESINESNGAGFPGPPSVARPTLLILLLLSAGLMFSCSAGLRAAPAMRSGIVTVCTGVMPPNGLLLPPQNAFAARRGDAVAGRSLCVFAVSNGDVDAELRDAAAGGVIDSGLGGGRAGESASPAGERRALLSALISCCKAAFSDLVEPSSVRIASMSRSRSATSPSRVVMYSVYQHNPKLLDINGKKEITHLCGGCENCARLFCYATGVSPCLTFFDTHQVWGANRPNCGHRGLSSQRS